MSEDSGSGIGAGVVLHVEAGVEGAITIPGGDALLVADYVRDGNDLILVGPDGTNIVVDNYFSMANAPTLVTQGGAQVPGDLVAKLVGPMAPGQYAQATGGDREPIGQVETAEGSSTIIRADGTSETLEAGVPIY